MKIPLNKMLLSAALGSLPFVALSAHAGQSTPASSFEELAQASATSDATFHFSSLDGIPVTPSYIPILPAVPEPQTYALLLAGLAAGAYIARRRKFD